MPRAIRRFLTLAITATIIATAASTAAPATASPHTNDVFGDRLYREHGTDAEKAVTRLRSAGRFGAAAAIDRIASQPTAIWLGDWFSRDLLLSVIRRHVDAARRENATLVFVTYAIPNRDCGGYSAGGTSYDKYLDWNRTIANALYGTGAVVLIEPDSLSMLSSAKCAGESSRRLPLIRKAVDILAGAGLTTYLDGGNSRWLPAESQAVWLRQAGIAKAHGFYTNISNFNPVQSERDYAGKVSSRVGWKHFVIDVSRNGTGWQGTWCNPTGAALGQNPHATAGTSKLDALLWVKHPGASDGTCNGGPAAGVWWDDYAVSLVRNR